MHRQRQGHPEPSQENVLAAIWEVLAAIREAESGLCGRYGLSRLLSRSIKC